MRDQPPEPPESEPEPPEQGTLTPLGPVPLAAAALLGLVLGSLWRPLAERLVDTAPLVSWVQGGVLFFVATVLGATAVLTWREMRDPARRPEPHQAVNRFVLARACALVGALVAGVYAGYAVSWFGPDSELAQQRVWRSLFAAVGGVALLISGKFLERACRVPRAD